MRIAMLSSEIAPFAKTGGLADVIGTLAPALERAGHELSLIMPAHRSVLRGYFALDLSEPALSIDLGGEQIEATVLRSRLGSHISVYLVRADTYFDRDYLYGTPQADYPDNAERFIFFSRACLEVLRRHPVDIVHAHDWQTALAIVFLKAQPQDYSELSQAKTVFTLHNLGFQGLFDALYWPLLNLDPSWFTPSGLEFYARINFLKGALVLSDNHRQPYLCPGNHGGGARLRARRGAARPGRRPGGNSQRHRL
jgi:starch synthase